jgi:uncharacterized cupin superfamily protein
MYLSGDINFQTARAPSRGDTKKQLAPSIQAGCTRRTDLQASPLDPAWIRAGDPTACALPLTESRDGLFTSGLWECTPGEFQFIYACDEVVHILEGEVTIREPGGEYALSAGDVAYFPKGLIAEWTVHKHVKKFCVFHSAPRCMLGRVLAKLRSWLRVG